MYSSLKRIGVEPPSSASSRRMRAIHSFGNKSTEQRLRMALVAAGVRGWLVNPRQPFGNPDFYFRRKRLAVFVHGCFWHGCPTCYRSPSKNAQFWQAKLALRRRRDLEVASRLQALGHRVLSLWEHELRDTCNSAINAILQSGASS
jgi:DNA mismatch endonuclease Vsr